MHDAVAFGGVPRELDRCLDRLRTGVGKDDATHPGMAASQKLLREYARKQGCIHLHQVRQVAVDRVVERLLDHRVRPSDAKDANTRENVQVTATLVVEEIGAFASLVEAVE